MNLIRGREFSSQVCIYLLYPSIYNPKKVLYLHKDKPNEPTHQKYVGFGGKIEEEDFNDIFRCAKRELLEELPCLKSENGELANITDIESRGVLIREDKSRLIYLMVASLTEEIPEIKIFGEGHTYYRLLNFHKTHPHFFLKNDLMFLDLLFYNKDNRFEVKVDLENKISMRVWQESN